MIYIENTCTDPTCNLALEEYVFRQMGADEPVLLLWQNEPSVIIGRFQNTAEEINAGFVEQRKIHVVRRGTGGGAVYHDLGNLNYSFIVPDVESKIDFGTFTIPVVKALLSLGVDAEQTGRNDILAGGRKFSGNAQQFADGRMLHHGTLMFDVCMEDVAAALQVKEGKFRSKATKSVRSRVTNLKPLLAQAGAPEDMTTLDFKALLLDWFRKEYDLREIVLGEDQLARVRQLRDEKYRSHDWNYGRSPAADVVCGDFFRCGQVEFHISLRGSRIRRVRITGDFFAARDIEELEQKLEGLPYEREALLAVLRDLPLDQYLGDVTAEELVKVIV
ncbi:MAG: lipoate--protein ligase [Firmicutes bacterium]|nr:lipoate--protein ligase [Bacillota bacterium]